jgi:hypothetical protein
MNDTSWPPPLAQKAWAAVWLVSRVLNMYTCAGAVWAGDGRR